MVHNTNVGVYIQSIGLILREGTFIDKRKITQIKWNADKITRHISYVVKTHSKSLHPLDVEGFQSINKNLDIIKKSTDSQQLRLAFQGVKNTFAQIYSQSIAYLLRHPEPPEDGYTDAASSTLSNKGTKEAAKFSEYLAEEVLLCPKKVRVHIFYSTKARTELFGKFIMYKMNQLRAMHEKEVEVDFAPAALPLMRSSVVKDLMDEYEEFRVLANGIKTQGMNKADRALSMKYFLLWSRKFESARNYATQILELLTQATDQDSSNEWNIFIYITHNHSFIPVTMHVLQKGLTECLVQTAEYIKKQGNGLNYRGNWYEI
ncbi:MAG: hypothetical protein KKG59_02470 [Nanoarchaeota archaeon]|nr:hypothetical protein [Nanoarchaeota archaeon]